MPTAEEFHLSREDKAKLQQAAQELEVRRDEIEAARDEALAQLTAETKSGDPFVRRARPLSLCPHHRNSLFHHHHTHH